MRTLHKGFLGQHGVVAIRDRGPISVSASVARQCNSVERCLARGSGAAEGKAASDKAASDKAVSDKAATT